MTHQTVGIGLAAVSVAALDARAGTAAALVGAAWVGSLLPDADLAGARIHRRTRLERAALPLRMAGSLARLPLRLLTALPHRGITHSLPACALAALLAAALASLADPAVTLAVAAGVAIGYSAHIAADACTPGGVRAWAPFSRRRTWLLPPRARIKTGSAGEYALLALCAALLTAATLKLSV
jgi:membrane-bound metal-dependent hydrolase YbcI (DUF457 family)